MTTKIQKSSGNVFKDLGFTDVESESLRVRSLLMAELRQFIETKKITQAEAGKKLGVSQPRVSDLMRGKMEKFSTDMLIEMLARVGIIVSLTITDQNQAA